MFSTSAVVRPVAGWYRPVNTQASCSVHCGSKGENTTCGHTCAHAARKDTILVKIRGNWCPKMQCCVDMMSSLFTQCCCPIFS